MAEQFAAPPINPIVSIRPLTTPSSGRDATAVPAQLANLPPGTTLQGFVVNRDAQSNPILRTPVGDLQLQSDVFVKTGSEMVIRVDATSETRARIVTIDGMPPQEYATNNLRGLVQDTIMPATRLPVLEQPGAPAPAVPSAGTQPAQIPVLQGAVVNTQLPAANHPLFTATPATALPAGLLTLQAGAMLKVSVLQLELPTQIYAQRQPNTPAPRPDTPAQQPPSATPATTNDRQPIAPAELASPQTARVAMAPHASPVAPAVAPAASPPSTPTMVTPAVSAGAAPVSNPAPQAVAPALPPQTPAAPAPTNEPAKHAAHTSAPTPAALKPVHALVVGHEPDGGNLIQTPVGVLKIYTGQPIPMHSKLTVAIVADPNAPPRPSMPSPVQPLPVTVAEESLSPLSREWLELTRSIQHLEQTAPELARSFAAALPQPGPKFASTLLFFIAAVKGGDMRPWLGNRVSAALESALPDRAARLKGDMAQMQQLFMQSPLDQWSGMMLPVNYGNQLDYARFYLRDEQDEGDKQQGKAQEQRFIVEVSLSHLGELQFDGFVRQTQPKKQFDLIVRSSRPLEAGVSNDIRQLFETALAATGYQGYLGFQQGAQHFVRPLAASNDPGDRAQDGHTILA